MSLSRPADDLERAATRMPFINKAVANFIKRLTAYIAVNANGGLFEHLRISKSASSSHQPINRLFSEPPTDFTGEGKARNACLG